MPPATPVDDPPPQPPVQPDLDDCCHSGCNPCVFDRYDEALERYQAALAEWQTRQTQQARPTQHKPPTQPNPQTASTLAPQRAPRARR